MKTTKGRFTLPTEKGMGSALKELATRWGADAVRDSDGTQLPPEALEMGLTVYSTLCLVREDNEWAKAHRDCLQQVYLSSDRYTALGATLEIPLMARYFDQQFAPDLRHDPRRYWQVMDRTANEPVSPSCWTYDAAKGAVVLRDAKPGRVYTASFLADQIWEPVSMYNHLTNSWKEEHRLPVDPRRPEARAHLLEVLGRWLREHPRTDVVRFTTFFYNFDLLYGPDAKERRVDWFGYLSCVSAYALDEFESLYGYRLTAEDFVDQGYYNTPFRMPTARFRDWMDYNARFVASFAKECVEMVHAAGKKAIMFLGDHWAGTEPYGPYFRDIGLDGVVGAGGDGVTTRMIADIPVPETEVRFYPYFFPDIFREGGDPVGESQKVWVRSRRALLRKAVGRMGYGGYPSLAVKFPEFVAHVEDLAAQFRSIVDAAAAGAPRDASFEVGILTGWGEIRTWMSHQVAHSLWNQLCYSYLGAIEALAGMDVKVRFLSTEQVAHDGVPEGIGVLVNVGDAGTAWTGAAAWADPRLQEAVRLFVARGGGFVGVGEPTAHEGGGAFFQLSDVLGVQKEIGYTLSDTRRLPETTRGHFVAADMDEGIDLGEGKRYVHPCPNGAKTLLLRDRSSQVAVNEFGAGRSVYISGLPYGWAQNRLMRRAVYWAAGKEAEFELYAARDPRVECHYYPAARKLAVANAADEKVETTVVLAKGDERRVSLEPLGLAWLDV